MKHLFLFVLAIFSLAASAQGLGLLGDRRSLREQRRMRELERQRQEDAKKQLLGEQMPFTNAVTRAKTGDGAGLFALAIYVSQGEEVQTNGKLAYKYLCAAVDAGDANAIFVKHLLEERKTENGFFRARNLDSYIGRCTFDYTNRFCEGRIDVGQRDVAEKLLTQYRADFERGVAAATNEIARIEAEIKRREAEVKRIEESKEQKRIADEQKKKSEEKRKRNAELLASEMGDKVVLEEQNVSRLTGGTQPFHSLGNKQWLDPNTGITWIYTVENAEACVMRVNSETNSISIPSSIRDLIVTHIGGRAFSSCRGLASVTIPPSVTNIGSYAFYNCSELTSVTIPSSVMNIGEGAFSGCSGLKSVTIPSSVTSIGTSAFSDCSGLTRIDVGPANPSYISSNGLLLTKDGTVLVQGINGDVTIPSSVTSIGDSAFRGCSGLKSVTIPSSVTNIDEFAFFRCSGLKSVTIPPSVTSIGEFAFSSCSGLTSVMIPSNVTNIKGGVFSECSGLTSVTIPSSVTNIDDSAFFYCSGLTSVTIPSSVTNIGDRAFECCSGLTSVTIPSSVTSIGESAFSGCRGLKSVTIPKNVTSIRSGVFCSCYGLTYVYVDEGDTARVKSLYMWKKDITFVEGHAK